MRFLYLLFAFEFCSLLFAADVSVQKSTAGWNLNVDGTPFFVRGVGCNKAQGEKGEDYLLMAKEMGANAVRTWGFTPVSYFDKAAQYGLLVDAGVWFNAIREGSTESYEDKAYCQRLRKETLEYVRKMKGHPALLMWNLGNEVFAFTKDEPEKKAFGLFLKDLIDAVHAEDPRHPVVYACSSQTDFPDLKAYVPNLDIVGVNVYGAYHYVLRWLKENDYDRPVLATEYGSFGGWDRMKDTNRLPYDPYDQYKAGDFANVWREIESTRDQSIGGFAFNLGDQRNQDSLTWYNVNYGSEKRQAYWTLYELYTGRTPARHCPKIKIMKATPVKDLAPGSWVDVSVNATDPDESHLRYSYFITDIVSDPLIVQPPRFYPTEVETPAPGEVRIRAPNDPGSYRLYVLVEDGHDNAALANQSLTVGRKERE